MVVTTQQLPKDIKALYPFAAHYLPIANESMHYLDEGKGPVLLMVHGNPSWSFYFRAAVQAFSQQYRVIVPDHLGCGLSSCPTDADYSYTLAQRVADLEHLLDCLAIKGPITLLLHDWGGMIGLALATRRPAQIARIIVTNTGGFPLPEGRALPPSLKLARTRLLGTGLIRGLNLFCRGAARYGVVRGPLAPAVRRGLIWPYRSWQSRRAVQRFVEDIPLQQSDPSYAIVRSVEAFLPKLRNIPRLVLWGEKDFVFDRYFLQRWRELWPDASFVTLKDAGHYLFEDAWPESEDAIRRFFVAHPLSSTV